MPPENVLFTIPLFNHPIHVTLLTLFGMIGNVLFTVRMLIQWLSSEKNKKSVVPVSFWWISLAGTLVFIVYAYLRHELPFILGYAVTLVPYVRNLAIHYRPHRPPRSMGVILGVAMAIGCILLWSTWARQGRGTFDAWFYFGLVGNFVFMSRFIVAWVVSEKQRQSVLPLSFWMISLVGSTILLIYSLVRGDLVFILGFIFNGIPYVRNIMLIRRQQRQAAAVLAEGVQP